MKAVLIVAGVLLASLGYYLYEMWGFAKGVNEDTKRRNEILKVKEK